MRPCITLRQVFSIATVIRAIFQVTVQTESGKQIEKLRRKEEKKNKRIAELGLESEISEANFSYLLEASEKNTGFDDLIGSGEANSLAFALPQGTVRKHLKGYEEVFIPPTPTAQLKPGEKLVRLIHI